MAAKPISTYCVIGVRDDGTRVQIDEFLSVDRANDIQRRLTTSSAFHHVVIEKERPGLKVTPPQSDASAADSVYDLEDTEKAN